MFYEDREIAEGIIGRTVDDWHNINARGRALTERDQKLDNERAMNTLMKISGLKDSELLFQFYQSKFVELGSGENLFEYDKLSRYTALLCLCISRPFLTKLPIPRKWEHSLLENYYTLDEVKPWVDYHLKLSKADEEYDKYLRSWIGIKTGEKTHMPNNFSGELEPVFLSPEYSLRLDLALQFSIVLLKKLKDLLSLKKTDITSTLRRNLDLTDLLYDISRYEGSMLEVIRIELKDELDSLKGDDALSELCVSIITEKMKTGTFDRADFEAQLIAILWDQLLAGQKTDEGREQVELIRRAISGEIYSGISEEVV